MPVVAYLYTDPLLEPAPNPQTWGWELAQVYQDLAVGATPPEQAKRAQKDSPSDARPQWRQLLQDCRINPPDSVLVRRLEDLGESIQEVGDRLAELETLNIPLIELESIDLASEQPPAPNLVQAELLHRLQVMQQAQRSRRIRQGHARNRVKALPPPGKAPYGYRRGKSSYAIDRSAFPVVKDFFEQFLLYGSVRSAVRYLAKRYGKKIAVSTGQRWLTNPVYRGDLAYRDGRIVRDTHAAILSRDEAAQVDRLLRRNRRLPPRAASAPRSLSGLVVCSQCQSSMTVTRVTSHSKKRAKKQEYLYLRPTQCPQKPKCSAIAYDDILQETIQRICEDLPRALAGVELPDINRAKQGVSGAIAAKQALLDQLPPLIASGVLDSDTADLRTYKLRTEIADLENQLAQLPPVDLIATAQAVSIPQFWYDLSEPERRFYLREFIRQILLNRDSAPWTLTLVFFFSPPLQPNTSGSKTA